MNGVPDRLPPNVPALPSSWWQRFCRWAIGLSGWRIVGELPNLSKVVLIGAPHSSYWDGVWGLLMKSAIGLDLGVMIKREVLNGPFGPVVRRLGMIPIDRSAAMNVVDQMVERFATHDKMWLGIAPEGTRKPVKQWKSGFLRIARAARRSYPARLHRLSDQDVHGGAAGKRQRGRRRRYRLHPCIVRWIPR